LKGIREEDKFCCPRLEIERPRGRKPSEKVNVTCGGADLEGLRLEVWAGKRETCVMTGVPQVPGE
jgi:hypothetical protein